MAKLVVSGAMAQCTKGTAPAPLTFPPSPPVLGGGAPAGTIAGNAPMMNVAPFGMCTSLANPAVASATAAAMGVLTPQPCVPAPAGPWAPPSTKVMVGGVPALLDSSMLNCSYAGQIKIAVPGQVIVEAK
jgi:hypothetical protein